MGRHDLARGFHRLVRVLVKQPAADAEVPVLLVGIAVHAPEAVLLLAPQSPFGGVETGVGEGVQMLRSFLEYGAFQPAFTMNTIIL